MEHPLTIVRAVGIACLFGLLSSCAPPTVPRVRYQNAAASLQEGAALVVLLAYDDNQTGGHIASDIAELGARGQLDAVHLLSIQDSERGNGCVRALVGTNWVPAVAADPAADPMDPHWLARTLQSIDQRFPAHAKVLVVSGHTQEWRGFGRRSGESRDYLGPVGLANVARSWSPDIIVFDQSWSARAELLVPLAALETSSYVVAARGGVRDQGIDYQTAADTLSRWAQPASERQQHAIERPRAIEALATDLAQLVEESLTAGDPSSMALVLHQSEIAELPGTLSLLASSTAERAKTRAERDMIVAAMLDCAQRTGRPGSALVPIDQLASTLHEQIESGVAQAAQAAVYLTDIDELGVPAGIRVDYSSDEGPSSLAPSFRALKWAPGAGSTGALGALWYRQQ